jgi:hypothetical protein
MPQVEQLLTAPEFDGSQPRWSPVLGPGNAYLLELKRRGYDKIEWEPMDKIFRNLENIIRKGELPDTTLLCKDSVTESPYSCPQQATGTA